MDEKHDVYTLEEMKEMEKAGEGQIYWFRKDNTYGSESEPIWVPKSLVPDIFGE